MPKVRASSRFDCRASLCNRRMISASRSSMTGFSRTSFGQGGVFGANSGQLIGGRPGSTSIRLASDVVTDHIATVRPTTGVAAPAANGAALTTRQGTALLLGAVLGPG